MDVEDPSTMSDYEVGLFLEMFGVDTFDEVMEVLMEIMSYIYGDDMYDMPDFDEFYWAFEAFGYELTEDIFDLLMTINDPSEITDDDWYMLFDMFGSDNQDEIMAIIYEVINYVYYGDSEDYWTPTFDELYDAFAAFGYELTYEVHEFMETLSDWSYLSADEWSMLYDLFGTDDQDFIMQETMAIIMSIHPDYADFYMPTFEENAAIYADFGYQLTEEIYNILNSSMEPTEEEM